MWHFTIKKRTFVRPMARNMDSRRTATGPYEATVIMARKGELLRANRTKKKGSTTWFNGCPSVLKGPARKSEKADGGEQDKNLGNKKKRGKRRGIVIAGTARVFKSRGALFQKTENLGRVGSERKEEKGDAGSMDKK